MARKLPARLSWPSVPTLASLALIPVIALYANKGMVLLLALGALGIGRPGEAIRRLSNLVRGPAGVALAALVAWCGIATLWAPQPAEALFNFAKLALLMAIGAAYVASVDARGGEGRAALITAMAAGGLLLAGLLGLEVISDGAIGRLFKARARAGGLEFVDPGSAILVLLAPVMTHATIVRTGSRAAAAALALLVLAVLAGVPMTASLVSFAVASAVWTAAYLAPRWTPPLIAIAFGLAMIGAPWIGAEWLNLEPLGGRAASLPESWQHRIAMWHYVAEKIADRPLLGHGFDASGAIAAAGDTVLVTVPGSGGRTERVEALSMHPHNAPLQIWLELGGIGTVLVLALLAAVTGAIRRLGNDRLGVATCTATMASYLSLASLSYNLWHKWWLATLWIAIALCVLLARSDAQREAGGSYSCST